MSSVVPSLVCPEPTAPPKRLSGSEAEERIRVKTEMAMRLRWPDARIIHELVLDTWSIRIDVAAVTKHFLCVAEIKSERDTLKRLPAQIAAAVAVADEAWVVVAPKHRDALEKMGRFTDPAYCRDLRHAKRYVEAGEELEGLDLWSVQPHIPDPRARFDLLWATERRSVLAKAGAPIGPRTVRFSCLRWAVENLSGAQIRQAVCESLLARPFPRADTAGVA